MIEDKLTRDERIRLECLAQAVALNTMKREATTQKLIRDAKDFEKYIRNEDSDAGT